MFPQYSLIADEQLWYRTTDLTVDKLFSQLNAFQVQIFCLSSFWTG